MPRFSPFAGSRLFLLLLLLLAALAAPAAPHAADAPQQGVLLVAFGTSVPEALPAMQAKPSWIFKFGTLMLVIYFIIAIPIGVLFGYVF